MMIGLGLNLSQETSYEPARRRDGETANNFIAPSPHRPITPSLSYAEVVKLANTLRSGRSERKLLWVQLPPSAEKRTGELASWRTGELARNERR